MRSEANALDLNNLPEEYGKQGAEESSTTTATSNHPTRFKKKRCDKDRKEDGGNIYECRFCSLKFCKSQALGGHMNRHRQERETETLNRARQLVFTNDGFAPVGPPVGLRDLNFGGSGQAIASFQRGGSVADSCLQFRPVYPIMRPPSGQLQQYIYSPQTSPRTLSYAAGPFQLPPPPPPPPPPPAGDYYLGRVLSGSPRSQPLGFGSAAEGDRIRLVMEAAPPPTGRESVVGGCHAYGLRSSGYPSTDPF
ncbi:zinc finger protein STAMENLESS 1-like [Wolffia australiana]